MEFEATVRLAVGEVIAARTGTKPRHLKLERKRFHGGEATETALVTARYRDGRDRAAMLRLVTKRLEGRPAREAAIYRDFVAPHASGIAPELLTAHSLGPDSKLILLEAVNRVSAWPWHDAQATNAMLARLGGFHTAVATADISLPLWDFDRELSQRAQMAWSLLDQCRGNPDLADLARDARRLDRLVRALPELRRQLLAEQPFGRRPIHGDVHPGNALVRRRRGAHDPVLIDWGRARFGSPLEDLSSWLQSLRLFEPEARRLHDTLFSRYLSAFGMPRTLTPEIRAAYWIAGASNALAGALLHHLVILLDPRTSRASRAASLASARDWLRIARRAHAWTM